MEFPQLTVCDSVFEFRPEYNYPWDYRIWVNPHAKVSLGRGISRDTDMEGAVEATRLHRNRYHPAELIYLAEPDPRALAAITDNRDLKPPRSWTADAPDSK